MNRFRRIAVYCASSDAIATVEVDELIRGDYPIANISRQVQRIEYAYVRWVEAPLPIGRVVHPRQFVLFNCLRALSTSA